MIKFWKEDFRYITRMGYYNAEQGCCSYYYTFSVYGESANYLMNKYDLDYPIINVNLFTEDNSVTVRSTVENRLKSEVVDIDDKEDLKELLPLLIGEVNIDLRNYEEYMCDSEFTRRDSRWN